MDWNQYRPESFEYNGKWIKNWFSNMVYSPITIDGITYLSVENYYQAMKSLDKGTQIAISQVAPNMAKQMGRRIKPLRPDWEDVKYTIMKEALIVKFMESPWKEKLLDTGNSIIIEWNNWRDKIWGVTVDDGLGQNLLGKALMEVRDLLRSH